MARFIKGHIGYRKGLKDQSKRRYSQAKSHSKSVGHLFTFDYNTYTALVKLPCYYCNNLLGSVQIECHGTGLDRIDNSKGYEDGNVLPCCKFCNMNRGPRLSVDENKALIQLLLKLRGLI